MRMMVTRFKKLLRLVSVAGLVAYAYSPAAAQPGRATEQRRPKRAILITVDTLRADVLGAYGGPAETPEIDAWARSGWRFERSYAAAMLTNPSHASIFASLYPRDHGVYDNESGIGNDVRTLAQAFHDAGFATAAVVAFAHLNPNVAHLDAGFDAFGRAGREELRAEQQVDRALAAVDAFESERFFLWLHIGDPHAPYEPIITPEPILNRKTRMRSVRNMAPGFQKKNRWFARVFREVDYAEQLYDGYVGEVQAVDAALKRFRRELAERGLWEDTLVVLTSDHGENWGERDLWFHHGGLYDAAVQVPLIVVGPTLTSAVDARLVEHVDIAPTLLEIMGVPAWKPMRGSSLLAQRDGRAPAKRYAFSEHMLAQAISVRDHEWTAILHRKTSNQFPTYRFRRGKRELWRRAASAVRVDEKDWPRETERLFGLLERHLKSGLELEARDGVDQDREALRALGYVE